MIAAAADAPRPGAGRSLGGYQGGADGGGGGAGPSLAARPADVTVATTVPDLENGVARVTYGGRPSP